MDRDEAEDREPDEEPGGEAEGGEELEPAPDSKPLASLAKLARQLLPGDSDFGDTLSTSGDRTPQLLARRIAEVGNRRPSALREVGLGALQVYQAISEAYGADHGERELTILFTDLVGFSNWSLEAGDEAALALLRAVDATQTPAVTDCGGSVVKRLGDGMMAVFAEPQDALAGAIRAVELVDGVEVAGHKPKLRAGLHLGEPKRIGSDYVGVDVNIAARVAEAAKGGEILVSGQLKERLSGSDRFDFSRKLLFRGKGTPSGMAVYSASG